MRLPALCAVIIVPLCLVHAQKYDVGDSTLYFDTVVNPMVYRMWQLDSTLRSVDGYRLIGRNTFERIIGDGNSRRLLIKTSDGLRYKLKSWRFDSLYISDDTGRKICTKDIAAVYVRRKIKLSRLLWLPVAAGIYFGFWPSLFEGIDYLYSGHFNSTEVLTFCAVGFTLGVAGSIVPDTYTINFVKAYNR